MPRNELLDVHVCALYAATSAEELAVTWNASIAERGTVSSAVLLMAARRLAHFNSPFQSDCTAIPPPVAAAVCNGAAGPGTPAAPTASTAAVDSVAPAMSSAAAGSTGEASLLTLDAIPPSRLYWRGNAKSKAELASDFVRLLAGTLLDQLPELSLEQASGAVHALASAPTVSACLPPDFASSFASGLVAAPEDFRDASTEVLTKLLCGFAAAGGRASGCATSSQLLQQLRLRLAGRLSWGPIQLHLGVVPEAELPAVAWALAVSHADDVRLRQYGHPSLAPICVAAVETAAGDDAAVEKPNGEAAELMDALCLRARSHLMNRHSSKATFAPQDCAALVAAVAVLGHYSADVAALLDAVGGFVVRRLRARHLNAMSRLDHTAQLLWSMALIGHNTVVTPDILRATASEMARSFASPPPDTSEGAAAATSPTAQAGSSHPGSGVAEQQAMMHAREVDHVRTVLAAHWQLGMRPPDKLLLAVSPRLAAAAAVVDSQSAGELLHMLHDFEFDPGALLRSVLQKQAHVPAEDPAAEQLAAD
mmetsp:Transcript_14488/g.43795  ORF Transcript_14488/g.43795 Transcript_14488/m.43795 type:complete len:537 (-) Transcript_14488:200-1810(-)